MLTPALGSLQITRDAPRQNSFPGGWLLRIWLPGCKWKTPCRGDREPYLEHLSFVEIVLLKTRSASDLS